jgi:N,N'-diacetyllegionaminate synthase
MFMRNKIEIIAEIAQGYEGSLDLAKLLLKSAVNSGVDAVKFQMIFADELATKNYKHYRLFKDLEMSLKEWTHISNFCLKNNVNLYLDVFGLKSLKFCQKINVKGIKIHPTDATNYDLIENIAKSKIKKIILGIGGHNINNLEKTIRILSKKDLCIMIGFQSYPTPLKCNNINNIRLIYSKYNKFKNIKFGFADHEIFLHYSKMLCSLAIGAGATILEKHFTISKSLKLEDSESALEASEFKNFVFSLKEISQSFSQITNFNKYHISQNEKNYMNKIKRNVVAKKNINKNTVIKNSDVLLKRTADKNKIYNLNFCVGKISRINVKKNSSLQKKFLR